MDAALDWLMNNRKLLVIITGCLLALLILQRVTRAIRARRPAAPLHPKLAAYAGRSPEEMEQDRRLAAQILATSSTGSVAGYEIVQQIEAVFVEGYRTPQEAAQALKAEAGRRGANALINLSQQRTAAGRCTAQGDAVRVRPIAAGPAAKPPVA